MNKEQIEKSFRVAESFQRCGHILSYYVNRDPSLTAQWIINTALSIEIYFKCLYLIENGKELRGHHLLELFQSLSVSSRNAIKVIYTNEFVASPSKKHWDWFVNQGAPIPDFTQITKALEHANSAFVSWRYSYEPLPKCGFFGTGNITKAVRERIFELQPRLRSISKDPFTVSDATFQGNWIDLWDSVK